MRLFFRIRPLVGLLTLGVFSACHADEIQRPVSQPDAPRPHKSAMMLGAMSIPMLPTNGTGNIGDDGTDSMHNTGITLPAMSTVVIRVEGGVTLGQNSAHTCCFSSYPGALYGQTIGPGGIALGGPYTSLQVGFQYGNSTHYGSGWGFGGLIPTVDPTDSMTTVDTIHVDTAVMLWVGRTGILGGTGCSGAEGTLGCTCPQGVPCQWYGPKGAYSFSGTQFLTVERLEDDVTLTAVTQFGDTGRSVTFTPSIHNTSGSTDIYWWEWTPDHSSGARTAGCNFGANPCTTNVYESGTMKVSVKFNANNKIRTAKVHVEAIPCPKGDSLLDSKVVRDTLKRLWDSSYAGGPVNDRKERVGVILQLPSGQIIAQTIQTTFANQCRSDWNPPLLNTLGGNKVLGFVHTHPHDIGELYNCPQDTLMTEGIRGASDKDWDAMRFLADTLDGPYASKMWRPVMYVMDKNWLYRLKPTESEGAEWQPSNAVRRTAPACPMF